MPARSTLNSSTTRPRTNRRSSRNQTRAFHGFPRWACGSGSERAPLELDLIRDPQKPSLQHLLRLPEARSVVLVLLQHHVAVEQIEYVQRGVDVVAPEADSLVDAQVHLIPAIEVLAAGRNQV